MKKTILATMLTSLFAATAAQSATVVDSDGVSVDVFGEIQVQFAKYNEEDSDPSLDVKDANFGFEFGYVLTEDVSAIGVVTIDAQSGEDDDGDDTDGDALLDDAYLGFASTNYGTITFGKQVTVYDSAGISNDYEFGNSSFYEQNDSGEQVIKYSIDNGKAYGAIAYMVNSGDADRNDDYVVDGKLGVRFDSVELTAFYGKGESAGEELSAMNLEARVFISDLTLAAAFGDIDREGSDDMTGYSLDAMYAFDKVVVAGGWSLVDDEENSGNDNYYYANATYNFNSNVSAYAEVGGNDTKDSEVGYVAGMVVTF